MSIPVNEFLSEVTRCNLTELRTFRKLIADEVVKESTAVTVRSTFSKFLTIIDLVGVLRYHENWVEPPLAKKEVIEGGIRFN
jgi:hypothetical protein